MQLEEGYKPITEPLRQLLTNIKTEVGVKQEPIEIQKPKVSTSSPIFERSDSSTPKQSANQYTDGDPTSERGRSSTPKKRTIHHYLPSTMPSFLEMSEIGDTTVANEDQEESLNSSAEIDREVERSRRYIQSFSSQTYNDWIDTFHKLPRTYIDASVHDTEDLFDHQHGIKQLASDSTDKLKIGDSEVQFKGKDVQVSGFVYPGTVGLYELLFKKFPTAYKPEDLDNYMDILQRTNAYRKGYKASAQIQGTTSKKYTSIIRPYLVQKKILKDEAYAVNKPFKRPLPPHRPRSSSLTALKALKQASRQGTGIMMSLSKKPIDYVYFDDPNELVHRLKILIASQAAGHTGHSNEIISIVEELKEAAIIK